MDATAWSFVGLIIFLAIIVYVKVPGMIGSSLDKRAESIRKELDDARRLREEAQALLADYQRRRQEAESEAEGESNEAGVDDTDDVPEEVEA